MAFVLLVESANGDALTCAPWDGIIGYYLTEATCTDCTTIIGVATCNAASCVALTYDIDTYYKNTLTTCRYSYYKVNLTSCRDCAL